MYHKDDADCKIFLLDAKEGIAAKAMERINEKVGHKMVVGAHSPSFGFEKHEDECEKLVRIVNETGANVLLVGVGAPKQEKWIMKYRDKMPGVKVFMALGATIDFETGTSNGLLRFSKNLHWNGFIVSAWNLSVSSSVTSWMICSSSITSVSSSWEYTRILSEKSRITFFGRTYIVRLSEEG